MAGSRLAFWPGTTHPTPGPRSSPPTRRWAAWCRIAAPDHT